jgi:hypothetical protein
MDWLVDHPILLFASAFAAMWLASSAGLWLRSRAPRAVDARSDDFDVVSGVTLTLLALLIGFTVSMAASRYDERRSREATEANLIGTEYKRAELLPPADAAHVRSLLRAWLDQRVLFFASEGSGAQLDQINQRTDQMDAELWAAVRGPAAAQPTPITGLVVAGMNEVLDARGYTQAALWNRIPIAIWLLLAAVALGGNALLGYGPRDPKRWRTLGLVLPLAVAISFMLIADVDAPQHGLIRISPENLRSLAQSFMR